MGKFECQSVYEENLVKMVKNIAISDGVKDEHGIAGYLFTVKKQVDEWTFMELDDFYEVGVGENKTILPDELFSAAVGYALLLRYNLEISEYKQWAEKQKEYKDYLLEIVGIKKVVRKENVSKKKEDAFAKIYEELKKKRKIICFTEEETLYTLFGKYVQLEVDAERYAGLLFNLKEAYKYAISILYNGLNSRCRDHIECSKNIVSVLRDTTDAMWINCKRYLVSINIENGTIDRINEEYKKEINEIYAIKESLDDRLMQLKNSAKRKVEAIVKENQNKKNREFSGGGFGIGGMITGMAGANIMASINSSWADAKLDSSTKKLYAKLQEAAYEIYLGSKTCALYEELIDSARQKLENICVSNIFSDYAESQINAKKFVDGIYDISDMLSGDQLREIAAYLLFAFPCSSYTYELILNLFMGVRDELFDIARVFHLEDVIKQWSGKLIEIDEDEMAFSDLVISRKSKNVVEWTSLKYCGKKYKLEFKSEFPFFNRDNFVFFSNASFTTDVTFISKAGDIIRIWGGEEGKDVFNKEINLNSTQILEQVNGYENVNINDFSQIVETVHVGKTFIQMLHIDLLWDGCFYDSYMFTYLDEDVFITICYGNKNGMGSNSSKYYDMLKSLKISLCLPEDITPELYSTEKEIFEKFRKNAKKRATNYYKEFKYSINIKFASSFRRTFKALINGTQYKKSLICKYDYETKNKNIIKLLSEEEYKGQYILYYTKRILVTDFEVIIRDDKGKLYKFILENIREILPVEYYFMGSSRICVRTFDGNYKMIDVSDNSLNEYIFVSDVINFALKDSMTRNIRRDYELVMTNQHQEFIFCQKCKKVALLREKEGTIIRHLYCGNCNASSKYINRFIKDEFYEKLKLDYTKKMQDNEEKGSFGVEDEVDALYGVDGDGMSINQIIVEGDKYYKAKEYLKAKNIYINGLKKYPAARAIVESFFDIENGGLKLLEEYVDNKKNIPLDEYGTVMTIIAKIKNTERKTLLFYAAEVHSTKLVDELIKYNADVDVLYGLIDKSQVLEPVVEERKDNEKSIICKACGKKLKMKAKFCNFCGKKI